MDIFLLNRERMIAIMQNSLRQIRQLCGWSAKDLGEYMGVTRQTINNIETKKTVMSTTQYVALCAVLDKRAEKEPHIMRAAIAILEGNTIMNTPQEILASIPKPPAESISDLTLLDKWFMAFPESNLRMPMKKASQMDMDSLNAIAKYYKIIAHADFLLHSQAETFFTKVAQSLKEVGNKIIVPLRAIEVMQDAVLSFDPNLYLPAKNGLNLLAKMQKNHLLDIRGEETDQDLNGLLQAIFAQHHTHHRLFLLTQNQDLASDILRLNESKTIQSYPISAGRLKEDGSLEELTAIAIPEVQETPEERESEKNAFEGWATID